MNRNDSYRALTNLIATVNGWDEPRTMLWVTKMEALSNDVAVGEALDVLVETWDQPGAPSWAHFRQVYDARCRYHSLHRPALPAGPSNAISRGEYLRRLEERATNGDKGAADELAAWKRASKSVFALAAGRPSCNSLDVAQ